MNYLKGWILKTESIPFYYFISDVLAAFTSPIMRK